MIRRVIRIGIMIAVLCAVGVAAVRIDWNPIGQELSKISGASQIGMAVTWLLALLIRPLRMWLLIRNMAPGVSGRYWPIYRADVIAMAINTIIPARAGDMALAFVLHDSLGIRAARGASVVLVDRFFDFFTVVVLFICMLSAAPSVASWADNMMLTLLATIAALVCVSYLAVRMRNVWIDFLDRYLFSWIAKDSKAWRQSSHDLLAGLALIDNFRIVACSLGLSLLLWGAITTSYWIGIHAVWPQAPIAASAFAASAVALGFVIPVAPGGFGVFHAVVVVALSLYYVPANASFAFAIVSHALQISSILVIGSISLLYQGMRLRTLLSARGADP